MLKPRQWLSCPTCGTRFCTSDPADTHCLVCTLTAELAGHREVIPINIRVTEKGKADS